MTFATTRFDTPLGEMVAMASAAGVVALEFVGRDGLGDAVEGERFARSGSDPTPTPAGSDPVARTHVDAIERELRAYFAGDLREFTVPLDVRRGTPFERDAWAFLRTVPYGQTRAYGEQAVAMGRPGASRAVGRANGRNYVAIVVPCHRVVGADGSLTGYGGGVWRKRWLLAHERGVRATPTRAGSDALLFDVCVANVGNRDNPRLGRSLALPSTHGAA